MHPLSDDPHRRASPHRIRLSQDGYDYQDPVTQITIQVSAHASTQAVTTGTSDCDIPHNRLFAQGAGFHLNFEAY